MPLKKNWSSIAPPLFWLTATLAAFLIADALAKAAGRRPIVNHVLIAIALLGGLLKLTGTDYQTYFNGAQFVHFLLGPATVALAIPLYRQINALRRSMVALIVALLAGSATAAVSAMLMARLMGATTEITLSMAPKSVTTPIAMGVSEQIGGLPSLTAALVLLTGISGAVIGMAILTLLRVRDPRARGMAMGLAAHGIGTARALQDSEQAGAFSGLAMGLNGLVTALIVPLLAGLIV